MKKKIIRINSIGEAKCQTRNTKKFNELQGLDYVNSHRFSMTKWHYSYITEWFVVNYFPTQPIVDLNVSVANFAKNSEVNVHKALVLRHKNKDHTNV